MALLSDPGERLFPLGSVLFVGDVRVQEVKVGMKYTKERARSGWIRIFVVFVILMGFFVNTVLVSRQLETVVQRYISNSNRQLADQLADQLRMGRAFLEDFAESLGQMPHYLISQDLLDRKAEALELDRMFFLCLEGDESAGELEPAVLDGQDLREWADQAPVWNAPAVSILNQNTLLITAPVPGVLGQLVVGVENYERVQSSLETSWDGQQGMHLLLDGSTGAVLMAQTIGKTPFYLVELPNVLDALHQGGYAQSAELGDLFACAAPVEGTDWVQVSLSYIDTAMSGTLKYIWAYLLLVFVALVLLAAAVYRVREDVRRREKLFFTDALTGGYNREGFIAQAEDYLEKNQNLSYAVVWINLSEFRTINSLWGEETGNKTLQFIYRALEDQIRPHELVCRSRMDRFILLLHGEENSAIRQRIQIMIDYMNRQVDERFSGYTMNFVVGASRVRRGESITQAIANATYAGKKTPQKNVCVFYDETAREQISQEAHYNEMFESALQNKDFKVFLQPKVGLRPGMPVEAEALVRWLPAQGGPIFPDQFIPLFEQNGKICQLDLYMFEEVCRLLSLWREQGRPISKVSVNVSRFHLRADGHDLWKQYKALKERYQLPDGLVEIELTETVLIDENQLSYIKDILHNFRACGFTVALDDFGFAYSSLALLKELEIDTMKLDRSFFISENGKSRLIVKNLVDLAHSLGMQVVAEGIEDTEQVEALREMGCDYIQGYVFSRPLPVGEFEKWRDDYGV